MLPLLVPTANMAPAADEVFLDFFNYKIDAQVLKNTKTCKMRVAKNARTGALEGGLQAMHVATTARRSGCVSCCRTPPAKSSTLIRPSAAENDTALACESIHMRFIALM